MPDHVTRMASPLRCSSVVLTSNEAEEPRKRADSRQATKMKVGRGGVEEMIMVLGKMIAMLMSNAAKLQSCVSKAAAAGSDGGGGGWLKLAISISRASSSISSGNNSSGSISSSSKHQQHQQHQASAASSKLQAADDMMNASSPQL